MLINNCILLHNLIKSINKKLTIILNAYQNEKNKKNQHQRNIFKINHQTYY